MNTPGIRLTDVSKRFGSHSALDHVSLDVAAGESAVILGPSGCGKTTLLRVIAGLEIPEHGQVVLNGTTVAAGGRAMVPPHQRNLGFVFQDLALWPHLTVLENLDFVLGSAATVRAERRRRAREVLELVRERDERPTRVLVVDLPPRGDVEQRVAVGRLEVDARTLRRRERTRVLDRELAGRVRAQLVDEPLPVVGRPAAHLDVTCDQIDGNRGQGGIDPADAAEPGLVRQRPRVEEQRPDPPPRLHDHGIVVVDTNPGEAGATYYSYQVWVVKPGSSQTYSNAPEIINKGG